MLKLKYIGIVIVLCFISIQLSAQSVIQIEKRAFEAFKLAQYSKAKVDFQQLLARDPESDSYNYHYAVCVFHTENKQHAKKYFEFVANRSISFCESHYYLGKIHHLNYRFDMAISSFKAYLACNPSDNLHANREINFCNNGKSLLENPKSISTLGVQLATEETFIQKYDLDQIGGKIYSDPSLQTKIDKKKNYIPTCYYKRGDSFKFYASYGDEATILKLFYIQRISQDVWSKPTLIAISCPDSDMKYPFYDPTTKQLYFSSNGFNSMGGFDLFRVSFDPNTNEIGNPENMDFPFSSTADDYFFIPLNSTATLAWFSSNRNTYTGAIEAMHVSYAINAQPLVAISGSFSDFVDPKNKRIQISVTDKADGTIYGPFTSDELGNYKLMLPGEGTYVFNAAIEGTDKVFQHEKYIPQQKDNVGFKQAIKYAMSQEIESADFFHDFNASQTEEMKAFKANAIAQLSLKAHTKPNTNVSSVSLNSENELEQYLESLAINGGTLNEKSEHLVDKLLEISNTGFDLSDISEDIQFKLNITKNRLDSYQKQADYYKGIMNNSDTIANQRFAAELIKINDSIEKYELELASWSLSAQNNQAKLNIWNDLNAEPTVTALSEQIQMALIQDNQDSLTEVLTRNANAISQFLNYSESLENSSTPILSSNDLLYEEIKQLEASEHILNQQIDQILEKKKTASKKQLSALTTEQESMEQLRNVTRIAIASKMEEIKRNEIINSLKLKGHVPTDSIVDQLFEKAIARKTELPVLQSMISTEISTPSSIDHQLSALKAESNIIQNQLQLASRIEKEALANKLQELEASMDSLNNLKFSDKLTDAENLVSNESNVNNVDSKPIETSPTIPIASETNLATNEGTSNETSENPTETSPTNLGANQRNPESNSELSSNTLERTESANNGMSTTNNNAANSTLLNTRIYNQQETEVTRNVIKELQGELSALQLDGDDSNSSMSILKDQLSIAETLLMLKSTNGDSIYSIIIGEKQGTMFAQEISKSLTEVLLNKKTELQMSENAIGNVAKALAVSESAPKVQPFVPSTLVQLSPERVNMLASNKTYDEYIGLRKEYVIQSLKRIEVENEIAQKRLTLFQTSNKEIIDSIGNELVELAKTVKIIEANELNILSILEQMADFEAYNVLSSQGVVPKQNLAPAQLDEQSMNFKINQDKKQGNRYPILNTLPEGLIFRIQVGVFRNAVPDYFFREFSPVSGERLTNELTAYLTGFFVNSLQANEARKQVRGLGYTDAFIVAYCDGKRIPIKQALEYEKKGLCNPRDQGEVLNEATALLNAQEALNPTSINIPKELYYTVQVAALKNQDNGKLNNVPALFYFQSKTGLYKYNSGKFKQLNDAKLQRDALKKLGYTDAYIVAYRDGIAVSFKEIELALAYEKESDNLQVTTSATVNTDLDGIELIDPVKMFYSFSKQVDALQLEEMNVYNRMEAFIYTPNTLKSAPFEANDISPLIAIYYSDFTLSEFGQEPLEKLTIHDESGAFPIVHDFAIRNQIPFRVTAVPNSSSCIDFYPFSEANREAIRKFAEELALNIIVN